MDGWPRTGNPAFKFWTAASEGAPLLRAAHPFALNAKEWGTHGDGGVAN